MFRFSQGIVVGVFLLLAVQAQARSYADVKRLLHDIALRYPETSRVVNIGYSDVGDIIQGLQAGNGPVHQVVVGTHHGNEYGSTEVAKAFAIDVAANPIMDATVFVIPVLNISGYEAGQRREIARGTTWDPNRNYPSPCGTEGPFTLKSTASLAQFIQTAQIVTSATLHTYYPVVAYPWGISTRDVKTPYDNLFRELTRLATLESGYPYGNSTETIYPADGTYEDYAYWRHGIWSILFELGYSHNPTPNDVREMIRVNVPGIRRLLAMAPKVRAENHDFTGKCDRLLTSLDRHDE